MTNQSKQAISEEFWIAVCPFIPSAERADGRQYKRKAGAGRKPLPPRLVLEGIFYVLRTGCPWKALPKERYGSPSSVHRYYRFWLRQGVFHAMWRAGLAESDEMEGIAWKWRAEPDADPLGAHRCSVNQGVCRRGNKVWTPCKEMRRSA